MAAYTNDDIDLIARVVAAEARGEPYSGMLAVANVIVNRVESPDYPNCVPDVVSQSNQFAEPYSEAAPERCIAAAREICGGDRIFPASVDMFQRARMDRWRGRCWYCTIGSHNFYGR